MRVKCNKYEDIYGDIYKIDHQTLQKQLTLQNKLQNTIHQLNTCKDKIQTLQNNKNNDIEQKVAQKLLEIQSKKQHLQSNV